LAKGAIVLETIGVRRASDDWFARCAQGLRFGSLAQSIVKDNDVRPFRVAFVILGLWNEAIGDVRFFFVFNEIADVMPFLLDLPGNVSDQAGEGGKEESFFVHVMGG